MPPPIRPLSIFLLKEDVRTWQDAIKDPDRLQKYEVRSMDGLVVTRPGVQKTPWWTDYLSPHIEANSWLTHLSNSSTSALMLIRVNHRYFGFAFGMGRHLLDNESIEHDFGLRVVLNIVDPDQLKSIDSRTFDELTLHSRRDVSQGSSLLAFGIDVSRDVLRAVTGPPRDIEIGSRASGADALSLLSRAQPDQLPELCMKLYAAYQSDHYKERFGWIDQLRRVRDADTIERLDEHLVQRLRDRQLTDLHLAPPEPLQWDRVEGFRYSRSPKDLCEPDPRITSYLTFLRAGTDINLESLKRDRVYAINSENQETLESWSIYKSLVFEAKEGSVLHALVAGQWYEVQADFAELVLNFARNLPELALPLPGAKLNVREEEYNKLAAEVLDSVNMDRKLIRGPHGDPVELCDVLTANRTLLHVKKRGASSTLSHLFSQGLISAELLLREEKFRKKARAMVSRVSKPFSDVIPLGRPDPREWEVSFVVLTRSRRDTPLTLPFFSLVNLRVAALRLQDLGFKVSVRTVHEAAEAGNS